VLPGNTSHFQWVKSGEYITQVTAIGPLGLEYMDRDDDPRQGSAKLWQLAYHWPLLYGRMPGRQVKHVDGGE
jgi:hypothetical protein